MRSFRTSGFIGALIALAVGNAAMVDTVPAPQPRRRKQQPAPRRYYSGGACPPLNGARECARRVRQMARGDVLNWYPGQVRANWHG